MTDLRVKMLTLGFILVVTISTFCRRTFAAEGCFDPPWCELVGKSSCSSTEYVKIGCKTMCGTCEKDCTDSRWCQLVTEGMCTTSPFVGTNCKKMCGICKKDVHCPDIEAVQHADIRTSFRSPHRVGTLANFTCDPGFKRVGQYTITCLKNGTWSGPVPQCTARSCRRDSKKLEKGRKCWKRCNKDADCRGSFYTCQCDDWCGKSCFNPNAECPLLSHPRNGYVVENGWRFGQVVTYGCNDGYALSGPATRRCRSDRKWSGDSPFCVPFGACGKSGEDKRSSFDGKIIQGANAAKGAWPWQAVLMHSGQYSVSQIHRSLSTFAGGSVINEEWILSAAHVFTDNFRESLDKNIWRNTFLIVLGMTKYPRPELEIPDHIQIHDPGTVFVHPDFDRKSFDYDVALIRIGRKLRRGENSKFFMDESYPSAEITFSRYVRPVCLPCMKGDPLKPVDVTKNYDKQKCTPNGKPIVSLLADAGTSIMVTGFGAKSSSTGETPTNLQQGLLRMYDDSRCVESIQDIKRVNVHARFTNRMFCAAGGNETAKIDTCDGDSGGPVVRKFSENRHNYWMQIGIVSWGVQCAEKHPGFYASVPPVMDWIWQTLDNSKEAVDPCKTNPCLNGGSCVQSGSTYKCVCPHPYSGKDCDTGSWGSWSLWASCDVTCGVSKKLRSRRCHGPGDCVGNPSDTEKCNTQLCPGVWKSWSPWTVCDASCGVGKKSRRRSCKGPGACVGNSSDTEICNTQRCSGVWSPWRPWTVCDATCGNGTKSRNRLCEGPGICEGNTSDTEICNAQPCPGVWGRWSSWAVCDATCGNGKKSRRRRCEGPGTCVGSPSQTLSCYTKPCPGRWEDWSSWGRCSVTCGTGNTQRRRSCPSPGKCDDGGSAVDTRTCKKVDCPVKDKCALVFCVGRNEICNQNTGLCECKMGHVRNLFGTCELKNNCALVFCGERFTVCSSYTGTCECYFGYYRDTLGVCKKAKWSDWTVWAKCSKTCGSGTQSRSRTCSEAGKCVGLSFGSRRCNLQKCEDTKTKRDVLILIQAGGSVGSSQLKKLSRLAQAIVNSFCGDVDVGKDKTRIGVVTFDSTQHVHIDFNHTFNKEKLLYDIGNINYTRNTSDFTCLESSLQFVNDEMFTIRHGARTQDEDTEQIIFFFTDGCAHCPGQKHELNDLRRTVKKLTKRGISIISFIVGENEDSPECEEEFKILQDGTRCYQFFNLKSWKDVDQVIDIIETGGCVKTWSRQEPCGTGEIQDK